MATFDWLIIFLLVGPTCFAFIIYIIFVKKISEQKRKDWVGEIVACTDCSKQLDAAQMTAFQKYEFIDASAGLEGGISQHRYWEEVIPGKKRKNPLSDKLPERKVLCPSCAARFRYEIKEKERARKILGFILIIIYGIIIFAYFMH
jgi:hypothetical protein